MRVWLLIAVCSVGASLAAAGGLQTDTVSLDVILGRASWYVTDFIDEFKSIVAEEHYVQDSNVPLDVNVVRVPLQRGTPVSVSAGRARHRELRSDFLLVKTFESEIWQPFRDVFEVDHVPVRDREERLTKLFLDPTADNVARAIQIQDESARYNLGAVHRTINNPVFPLMLLQPEFQPRFEFTLGKEDADVGDGVWVVEYREQERPSIIQGRTGRDMLAHGRFWIEAGTGRIAKARLQVDHPEIRASLTVEFREDDRFPVSLPARMQEDYDVGTSHVRGTATYDRFRRFQVTTEEQITPR
jgi:hypothetical protein